MKFCSSIKRHPLPATESTLLLFVSHLATRGLSAASIKVYLSAVRHLHVTYGKYTEFSEQLTPRLRQVIKGIKKAQAALTVPKVRRPITLEIMVRIHAVISSRPNSLFNTMIWAACNLAFFGFLRCSEFTVKQQGGYDSSVHLSAIDIALDSRSSPKVLRVRIKQSKTDPFHQGVYIYLGRTDQDVCPVSAIIPYLIMRGGSPGPLFILEDGRMLTRQIFKSAVDSIMSELHLEVGSFNTHSFRIRAATSAIDAGIPAVQIQMLGRWRSEAYKRYVKTPPGKLAQLSKKLATRGRQARKETSKGD